MTLTEAISRYRLRHAINRFVPKAALIDMDGTLYDSMPNHAAAWVKMMAEVGCTISEKDIYIHEGMTGPATVNLFFQRELGHGTTPEHAAALYARKAQIFSELPPVDVIKGAQQMVESFTNHNIATVLVTGSAQSTTLGRLNNDFPGAFPDNRRITANDVTRCKPHPEPYIKAMQLAAVKPEQAIVIENAPLGVRAGADSGALTLGVTTGPVPVKSLYKAGADYVFTSMPELVAGLNEIYSLQ